MTDQETPLQYVAYPRGQALVREDSLVSQLRSLRKGRLMCETAYFANSMTAYLVTGSGLHAISSLGSPWPYAAIPAMGWFTVASHRRLAIGFGRRPIAGIGMGLAVIAIFIALANWLGHDGFLPISTMLCIAFHYGWDFVTKRHFAALGVPSSPSGTVAGIERAIEEAKKTESEVEIERLQIEAA